MATGGEPRIKLIGVPDAPIFTYALARLAPGRFPFRRWRWELQQDGVLVAAGWVTAPGQVERALRAAASRRMHHLAGVTPLRPTQARLLDRLDPTRPARLQTGVGTCLLVLDGGPDTAVRAA